MNHIPLEERETSLTQDASDRSKWRIYSADPTFNKKMRNIGAKLIKEFPDEFGMQWELSNAQITFRKKKRALSDPERQKRAERMRKIRTNTE